MSGGARQPSLCYNAPILLSSDMETLPDAKPEKDGLDTFIKVLTILKLMVQLAFYGILLGSVIWFLLNNPIPGLIEETQTKILEGSFAL